MIYSVAKVDEKDIFLVLSEIQPVVTIIMESSDAERVAREILSLLGSVDVTTPPPKSDLTPALGVFIKLGSLAVHIEEMLSPFDHLFDKSAIESLLSDPELKEWLAKMDKLAFLPKKRGL